MKRELCWKAVYRNGEFLPQYKMVDGVEIENKYPDIDRDQLVRFDMLDKATMKPVYALWLQEGQQLIYRRRTMLPVANVNPTVIYLVGYQHVVITPSGPRNFVVINYLYEDGSIALDGSRNNLQLFPFE